MTDAQIIDGKAIAKNLRENLKETVSQLKQKHNITPGLAVVLVGEDPASQVYVRNKVKQTNEVGMASFEHKLPANTTEENLLNIINQLNMDISVHGILVQLPLPDHIDSKIIVEAISPAKDVDGLHPMNAGYLALGQKGLVPCTPLGSVILAKTIHEDLTGLNAVVIGRSHLVGKPVAQLLLQENCTVTIAHSRTKNLPEVTKQADIVIAAVGRPEMVKADWIKPGATIIDVGINRVSAPEKGEGKTKLVGDVDFDLASGVAGAITPVPGGVGPMTIACLLRNTVQAACIATGIDINIV